MSLSCLLQVSHVLAMIMLRHTNNIPGRVEWRAQEAGKEKGGLEGRLAEGWSWLEGKVGQGLCSCSELRAALFRFSPHPFLAKCQRKYESYLEHKSYRTYRKKFGEKNKEIFYNECSCQINRFYSNINNSPTNCHTVANPIPCFQGGSNQIQVV